MCKYIGVSLLEDVKFCGVEINYCNLGYFSLELLVCSWIVDLWVIFNCYCFKFEFKYLENVYGDKNKNSDKLIIEFCGDWLWSNSW